MRYLLGDIDEPDAPIFTVYGTHLVYIGAYEVAVYDIKGRLLRGKVPADLHKSIQAFLQGCGWDDWFAPEANIFDDPIMDWDILSLTCGEIEMFIRLYFGSTDIRGDIPDDMLQQCKSFYETVNAFIDSLKARGLDDKLNLYEAMSEFSKFLYSRGKGRNK